VVRHDRVAAVLFYPKYCHFTDASFLFLGKEKAAGFL